MAAGTRSIFLCHDLERGLGHTTVDPDFATVVEICRLVVPGLVNPSLARRVELAGRDRGHFRRPHAGQSLHFDHGPHGRRDVIADRDDIRIGYGANRLRFTSFGSTTPQRFETGQSVRHGAGDQLVGRTPPKDPFRHAV